MPRRARGITVVPRLLSRAIYSHHPTVRTHAPSGRNTTLRVVFRAERQTRQSNPITFRVRSFARALDARARPHRRPTDRRGNFFPTVPASALSPILASPAFVIRRAGLRPLALSVKSPHPAQGCTSESSSRARVRGASSRRHAPHRSSPAVERSTHEPARECRADETTRRRRRGRLGDPTAREALARRRLTSRDRRKVPSTRSRGRPTAVDDARGGREGGTGRRSRLVRIRHVESHLAGREGMDTRVCRCPRPRGARERASASARRAAGDGACASSARAKRCEGLVS